MKTDNKADKVENVHIPGIIFTLELYYFLITVSRFVLFFSCNRSVGGSFQHCRSDETVLEWSIGNVRNCIKTSSSSEAGSMRNI